MIATVRAEFRKFFTVRSTYVVSVLALILIAIMAFYVEGYRGISGSAASALTDRALTEIIVNGVTTVSVFGAIISLLFMVHEYRHNTIVYTLTASNSRTKVLIAKAAVVIAYVTLFSAVAGLFAAGCYYLGLSLRGANLPGQTFEAFPLIGKTLFFNISYGLIGLMAGALTRNIAASIAALLILPAVVEPLLGLLLKHNAAYLPFAALDKVIALENSQPAVGGELSAVRAMMAVCAYVAAGWLISWLLFLKRDASSS